MPKSPASDARAVASDLRIPAELPISAHREAIVRSITENQVNIIAGETGSGKSTQLAKMALQAGYGRDAQIVHTQPRRLAAISIANHIAEELGEQVGDTVGFQIRFNKNLATKTRIKLVTDGVLLNELQQDKNLRRYDCIIIDEAHERSLNIDFLLGYLKTILHRRPELRLVITSATIDTERFSEFFSDAPILLVQGRKFPVQLQYMPPASPDVDLAEQVCTALEYIGSDESIRQREQNNAQDILCFLPTQSAIRETMRLIKGRLSGQLEVLPLYARLPNKEQQKVMRRGGALRRVILATNIAETSLSVPRIGYVIDSGQVRISRYSLRKKIQQLPIELVSQASADQRMGRCGRVAPGLCIRLFSEQEYEEAEQFTEPEILRSNLAAVVLRLLALDIRDTDAFPFLAPPDAKLLSDGRLLLEELQAVSARGRLTRIGRDLSRLPLEPRLGRALLAARESGCLEEVLVICAALSTQDPRERPPAQLAAAEQRHKRFADRRSDFLSLLKLWRHIQNLQQTLSVSQFRRQLRTDFISYQRVLDWQDIHRQLSDISRHLAGKKNRVASARPASYEAIHKAILSAYLGHIAVHAEGKKYRGVRQRQIKLSNASCLAGNPPNWIMSAEIIETHSLLAHMNASIKPQWILTLGEHLLNRSFSSPAFDVAAGYVAAKEHASLFGLSITNDRAQPYARFDQAGARAIFIREALAQGQWQAPYSFYEHNQKMVRRAESIAARLRRPEILQIEDTLYELFDARLPDKVFDVRSFASWFAAQAAQSEDGLGLEQLESLFLTPPPENWQVQFPDVLSTDGNQFSVRYHFCPGSPEDGIEILVPEPLRHSLQPHAFDDLVPGMLEEKCVQLLKTLPKSLRKKCVPIRDSVVKILPDIRGARGFLCTRLAQQLNSVYKLEIKPEDWQLERLPEYCRARISFLGEKNEILDTVRLAQRAPGLNTAEQKKRSQQLAKNNADTEGVQSFRLAEFDGRSVNPRSYPDLPEKYSYERASLSYLAYPGLLQTGDDIRLCLFHDLSTARQRSSWALASLFMRAAVDQQRAVRKRLLADNASRLYLSVIPEPEQFLQDARQRVFFECFACAEHIPQDAGQFEAALRAGRDQFGRQSEDIEALLQSILLAYYDALQAMQEVPEGAFDEAVSDVRTQLLQLIHTDFLQYVPITWLQHYPRYLRACTYRLQRLAQQQGADHARQEKLQRWAAALDSYWQGRGAAQLYTVDFYWLLQEYRVSLFAQQLKTVRPVSETRLAQAWEQLLAGP